MRKHCLFCWAWAGRAWLRFTCQGKSCSARVDTCALHHGSANASEIKACFSRWTIDEVSETFSRVFSILRRNADVDGRRGVAGEPFFLTAALCCDSGEA